MACFSTKCRSVFLFLYGLLGAGVGILVGIVFLAIPEVRNIHAGAWGVVSFLFALTVSIYGLLRWRLWDILRKITMFFVLLGALGLSLGTTSFIAYLVYGIVYTKGNSISFVNHLEQVRRYVNESRKKNKPVSAWFNILLYIMEI